MVSQFASSPPTPGPRHRHLLLLRVRASLAAPIQARLVTPSWVLTISHALTYVRARRGALSTRSCFRIFVSPCLRTDLGEEEEVEEEDEPRRDVEGSVLDQISDYEGLF